MAYNEEEILEVKMTFKKVRFSIFILIIVVAAVLLHTTMNLSNQKKEDRASIQVLTQELAQMEKKVAELEQYKKNMALYQFQDSIFKVRYPEFSEIAKIVFKKSKQYGFNPYLVMGLIQVESNFKPYAISVAGAYGLTQVNYSVWKDELDIDFSRIFNLEYNIDLGLKILSHYYEETNRNLIQALFHYNNGYKFNNTRYSLKVISTRYYANKDKAANKTEKGDNLSI